MSVKIKVMTYNIYRGGEDRIDHVATAISGADPDILVIQEANYWDENNRLSDISRVIGITPGNSILFQANQRGGKNYNIVVLSKLPIEKHEVFSDPEIVWHAIGHVVIKTPRPLHVVAVHLCPHSEEQRLKEVSIINTMLDTYPNEPMILLGDLNSLSDLDAYPKNLATDLAEHGISKFGNPPRFDVLRALRGAGWIDFLGLQGGRVHTTVQKNSEDPNHLDLRLDYILVNAPLRKNIHTMYVEKNEITQKASDHFPVAAEFDI